MKTLKEHLIIWIDSILFTVLALFGVVIAVIIFAAITVGVVMSGMWTASLFK